MMLGHRDRMICRYLDGMMSNAERESFLQRLESDPILRDDLRMEEEIRRAMLRDAASIPMMQHMGSRANAMSTLVATPSRSALQNGTGAIGAGRGAAPGVIGASIFTKNIVMKSLLGLVIAGLVIVGAHFLTSDDDLTMHNAPTAKGSALKSDGDEAREALPSAHSASNGATATGVSPDAAGAQDGAPREHGTLQGHGTPQEDGTPREDGASQDGSGGSASEGRHEIVRQGPRGAASRDLREGARSSATDVKSRNSEGSTHQTPSETKEPARAQSVEETKQIPAERIVKPRVVESNRFRVPVKIDTTRR